MNDIGDALQRFGELEQRELLTGDRTSGNVIPAVLKDGV